VAGGTAAAAAMRTTTRPVRERSFTVHAEADSQVEELELIKSLGMSSHALKPTSHTGSAPNVIACGDGDSDASYIHTTFTAAWVKHQR
jgi:hypothetical protein